MSSDIGNDRPRGPLPVIGVVAGLIFTFWIVFHDHRSDSDIAATRNLPASPAVELPSSISLPGCSVLVSAGLQGTLWKLSDEQVEKALCLSARAAVDGIAAHDRAEQQVCIGASRVMANEFARRWPGRNIHEAGC